MKKLNQRESFILMITLGLAVFFIGYQFVFRPMHEGSVDINDQLRVAKVKLAHTRQLLAQRSLIGSRYQDLMGELGVAGSEDDQVPAMVAKIESAARDSNIHIANIQPQRTSTQKEAEFLGVELEIDGQWLDIVEFLKTLQGDPNFYFINELNLEKYSDNSGSLRGRIVISRMCLFNP